MREKVIVTAYLTTEQKRELDQLREITRVPTAERLREAVDMLVQRYRPTIGSARGDGR